MKITGYLLREAIKRHELRRDTAARMFGVSLKKFADETKDSPQSVADQLEAAEIAVAQLQVAQAQYNLAVKVKIDGREVTLGEAIKRVGGAARIEKLWRSATGPKADRYGGYHNTDVRDVNQMVAKETVTPNDAMKLASVAGKKAGALRSAIAVGNAQEYDISLDAALIE